LNTHPLFLSFSLVFLSNLSTQNSISSACYLYTNSKQDISTFKCEGGWRLAVGGWAVTAGGCLPWPSRLIEFNTTKLPLRLRQGWFCFLFLFFDFSTGRFCHPASTVVVEWEDEPSIIFPFFHIILHLKKKIILWLGW